jgi:hypothetical protein
VVRLADQSTITNPVFETLVETTIEATSFETQTGDTVISFGPNSLNPGRYFLAFREQGDDAKAKPGNYLIAYRLKSGIVGPFGNLYSTYFTQRGASLVGPPVPETLAGFGVGAELGGAELYVGMSFTPP